MKTIAVLFVLSCLSLCFVNSMNVTTWGKVNTRVLGQETIVAERAIGYPSVRAFAFPSVSFYMHSRIMFIQEAFAIVILNNFNKFLQNNAKRFPITGIKHINNSNDPVKVTFAYGAIDRNEIALVVKSRISRGINSTFIFYGM